VTSTSESFLRVVPLFAGLEVPTLGELMSWLELEAGQTLTRQGESADALYIVVSGRVAAIARLPGGRETVLAELGPRDVFGELALLDGGVRTAGVRALEPTLLLSLSAADFRGVVLSRDPGARELRRRIVALACSRLGARHRALAATLDGRPPERAVPAARPEAARRAGTVRRREKAGQPDPAYLLRLPFFRHFKRRELDDLLARGTIDRVRAGEVLVAEGAQSAGLFVTLNGAVAEMIRRGEHVIRVELLGPGRGFGYASLVAGGCATTATVARERAVVLLIGPAELERGLEHDPFATAIELDVVAALRQADRPHARLAVSGYASSARGIG
jgi:CRP-like cAMP-binding protein